MTDTPDTSMTQDAFCARFVTEMMTAASINDGSPEELRAYAEQAAPTYWSDEDQRADGPEECAQSDIGYWEEG